MEEFNSSDPATWALATAQRHVPDVVTRAVVCKPNAPGRSMWSNVDAFGQRQILKAAGLFLAERVIVAITPLEVYALPLTSRGRCYSPLRWDRARAIATRVRPRGESADPDSPAFLISDQHRNHAVELIPVHNDATAVDLISCLTAVSTAHSRRKVP